jgi:hypothetical protein
MNANNQFGAMVPIASVTLTSSGYTSFSNIPTTYQDLRLVCSLRDTNSGGVGVIYFKESTYGYSTTDFSQTNLAGNGSSATSTRTTNQNRFQFNSVLSTGTAGVYSANTFDILSYANTATFKTVIMRDATDQSGSGVSASTIGLWRKTDAVTEIGIYTSSGGSHWAAGSTFTLYGIRAVS